MAASLSFPMLAFAEVTIDNTVINQGENSVGGGTATLADTVLDMVNVVAGAMSTDQNLTVNFNGGNEIEYFDATGSGDVTLNFAGENEVEDIMATDSVNLTLNANGHNDFESVEAYDDTNVVINVTGENGFEKIIGNGNANIVVRGTDCQMKDVINIEDGDDSSLYVTNGNLAIDHVTVNLEGEKTALVGSGTGDVVIDTSKIEAEDGAWAQIIAGKTMLIRESVIEIAGEVYALGLLTIDHSDVEAGKPEAPDFEFPYRVFSLEGVKLIDEENGEVREGEFNGEKLFYVDTDGNDGSDVDLEADGDPAYYKCKSSTKGMPKTGDGSVSTTFALLATASLVAAAYAARRRRDDMAYTSSSGQHEERMTAAKTRGKAARRASAVLLLAITLVMAGLTGVLGTASAAYADEAIGEVTLNPRSFSPSVRYFNSYSELAAYVKGLKTATSTRWNSISGCSAIGMLPSASRFPLTHTSRFPCRAI